MLSIEALPKADSIKKLTARFPGLSQSIAILATYLCWTAVFKFISLTFVTYFVLSSGNTENSHFEDVNEALSSSQLALSALCAGGYVLLLRVFQPFAYSTRNGSYELFSTHKVETRFLPGLLHGSVLAAGMTLAFLLGGVYRYLGFFIQADQAPLAMASLLFRICSITAFIYLEEFIFRQRILKCLTRRGELEETTPSNEFWHNMAAVAFTAAMYVGVKLYQFDLGWMQALTLYFVALALGLQALSGDFVLAAGFWAAVLIVFQALLSLPIFGNEFSGLILIKYQSLAPEAATEFWAPESNYGETLRFITGGAGGPLASLAFQLLILFDVLRNAVRYRRRLSPP
ncbi:MAG: hypothetical protein ACJ763_04690 [Bdellovibrionia bacterium]